MSDADVSPSPRKKKLARSLRLPLVSGKLSALVLAACFVLTAVIFIPFAWGIDPWIRSEIVLLLWWLIWLLTLTILLYSGHRISDDHRLGPPRNWLAAFSASGDAAKTRTRGSDGSDLSGCAWWLPDLAFDFGDLGEGCLVAVGVVVALVVAFFGLWLLIEIVIPSLAFVTYFLIRGMLARVANDFHGCKGNLGRALQWGALWATVYVAPLAVIVWIAHLVYQRPFASWQ